MKAGVVKNPEVYENFTKFDAAHASRRQHQLATMDDQPLRETRRLLVLSLQEIACKFPRYAVSLGSPPVTSPALESTSDSGSVIQPNSRHSSLPVQDKLPHQPIDGTPKSSSRLMFKSPLYEAIEQDDVELAIELYEKALACNQTPTRGILYRLFYLVVVRDPITAYSVLKIHRQDDPASLTSVQMLMYRKLCLSLASLVPKKYSPEHLDHFLKSLMQDLQRLDRGAKQELLPPFITGIVSQRMVTIGLYANEVYQYMVENDYVFNTGWLRQLLSSSKYNRQDDLPFHDILEKLAAQNGRPHPLSTIQAIHNMFPFTNTKNMCVALRAFLDIHKGIVLEDFPKPTTLDETRP